MRLQNCLDLADSSQVKHWTHRLVATLVVLAIVVLGFDTPATAAALTSPTFAAPTEWTYAGAKNARYDWGFTTATAGTLSKVTASVPGGTGGSNRYLTTAGVGANYASTPDSVQNSITGDIDVRAKTTPGTWPPSMLRILAAKDDFSNNQRAWRFALHTSGALSFEWSANGSALAGSVISSPITLSTTTPTWVRATLRVNNGSSQRVLNFYTSSDDGVTWTLLSTHTAGITSVFDSSGPLVVGANDTMAATSNTFVGKIHYVEVRSGINGPVVNKFDPNEAAAQTPSSWSSSTGETWTLNRSGTNMPADIGSDLSVGPTQGLPSGGTANYRFIDGVATYNLQSSTSMGAGTIVKLNLGGFTNTATPGSYASTIRTYDNAGTPAVVDSATTSALVFSDAASTSSATVLVDPVLTLTVSGRSGACNGVSPSVDTSSTGSTVNMGRLSSVGTSTAAQNISMTTNAVNGGQLLGRVSGPLSDGAGHTIPRVSGIGWQNAAAFPAVGNAAFGYLVDWWSTPNTWGALTTSNDALFQEVGPTTTNRCIAYRAQAGATTSAGTYQTSIIYTATPRY